MTKTALVFLAEGAEEMETVITVDVLRRAGINVTVVGLVGTDPVKCSRNVSIVPDLSLEEVLKKDEQFDVLVLPGGGGGAKKLVESIKVGEMLKAQEKRGGLIAAVCAAPMALAAHGIGKGKEVTCYPGIQDKLEGYIYLEDRVVVDGNLITSRGPGTCIEFALKIVEKMVGAEKVDSLKMAMLVK